MAEEESADRAVSRLAKRSSPANETGDQTAGAPTAEEHILAAMAFLSDGLTAAFKEACRLAPEVVKESNPRWFLRYDSRNFEETACFIYSSLSID